MISSLVSKGDVNFDGSAGAKFSTDEIDGTVNALAELADGGAAAEFAIGTGRIALPLTARGVSVSGMDISEPMLAESHEKPGSDAIDTTVGDMTSTVMRTDASLVYLVDNTVGNLRTQAQQVACFRNAAAHLRPGGRFVIEVGVPQLHQLPPGQTIRPFAWTDDDLGFDEYVDRDGQMWRLRQIDNSLAATIWLDGQLAVIVLPRMAPTMSADTVRR